MVKLIMVGDNSKEFKVRVNRQISDCKAGVSTCKFPRHVYEYGIKNNFLEEPFFSLNSMLWLNKSDSLSFERLWYNEQSW